MRPAAPAARAPASARRRRRAAPLAAVAGLALLLGWASLTLARGTGRADVGTGAGSDTLVVYVFADTGEKEFSPFSCPRAPRRRPVGSLRPRSGRWTGARGVRGPGSGVQSDLRASRPTASLLPFPSFQTPSTPATWPITCATA